MITEGQPITIEVTADDGTITSTDALSVGLIVTELFINAIKYAFPRNRARAQVRVSYEIKGTTWRLVVSDNGVGKSSADTPSVGGLGTTIINALVDQLGAQMDVATGTTGTSVSIMSSSSELRQPQAA